MEERSGGVNGRNGSGLGTRGFPLAGCIGCAGACNNKIDDAIDLLVTFHLTENTQKVTSYQCAGLFIINFNGREKMERNVAFYFKDLILISQPVMFIDTYIHLSQYSSHISRDTHSSRYYAIRILDHTWLKDATTALLCNDTLIAWVIHNHTGNNDTYLEYPTTLKGIVSISQTATFTFYVTVHSPRDCFASRTRCIHRRLLPSLRFDKVKLFDWTLVTWFIRFPELAGELTMLEAKLLSHAGGQKSISIL